jgi:hypothetical protein
MKFLIDMNLSPLWVAFLADRRTFSRPPSATSCSAPFGPLKHNSRPAPSLPWIPSAIAFGSLPI